MALIKLITHIKAPVSICFDLSRDLDLHQRSMAHTHEVAVAGKTSGLIGLNEWVTWQAKHLGFVLRMTVKITEMHQPDFFVDEMINGPFKVMRHLHQFKAEVGETIMTDEFIFRSPFGFIGKIVDKCFLEGYMARLLMKRNRIIKQSAEGLVGQP